MRRDSPLLPPTAGESANRVPFHPGGVDIHNIRKVEYVIANGKMYQCAPLWTSVGFKP
jgi:hypothetical protein